MVLESIYHNGTVRAVLGLFYCERLSRDRLFLKVSSLMDAFQSLVL